MQQASTIKAYCLLSNAAYGAHSKQAKNIR